MTFEAFMELAKVVGIPAALLAYIIINRTPAPKETPPQPSAVVDALKELSATVKANHEAAQAQREELRKAVAGHGERIARIEGRIEGL